MNSKGDMKAVGTAIKKIVDNLGEARKIKVTEPKHGNPLGT